LPRNRSHFDFVVRRGDQYRFSSINSAVKPRHIDFVRPIIRLHSESLPAVVALIDGIEIVANYDTLLSFARVLIDLERLGSFLIASEDKPRTGLEIIERIEEFAPRSTDWGNSTVGLADYFVVNETVPVVNSFLFVE
jgi:hypothetical protein